ncbi:MAG: hypothetical protein JXA82_18110 [Sedimentisphaerales bacterium]|nr:hypothetical protein [Sedimentisphaerales bacterium]
MRFLYFIPNMQTVTAEVLKDTGLSQILEEPICQRSPTLGPEHAMGVLLSMNRSRDVIFDPNRQRWTPSIDKTYWIGLDNETPPAPHELAREEMLAGHKVILGDGNEWLVPVARQVSGGCALPRSLSIGADGQAVTGAVIGKLASFWKQVEALWDDTLILLDMREGEPALTLTDRLKLAVQALSLNYRVTLDEVVLLGLLDTDSLQKVLDAVIDWPTLIEVGKRMAEDKKKDNPAVTGDG